MHYANGAFYADPDDFDTNKENRYAELVDKLLSGARLSRKEEFEMLFATSPQQHQRLAAMPYKEFLESDYWSRVRKHLLSRSDYHCQRCGVYSRRLDVHHLTYEHHGYEHLHLNDLRVLCRSCHKTQHTRNSSSPPCCFIEMPNKGYDRNFSENLIAEIVDSGKAL